MKRILWITVCVLLILSAAIIPAMAEGTLASPGDGLADYYLGMSKSRVKAVAPMFEELDNGTAIIDMDTLKGDEEYDGIDAYLGVDFEDNTVNCVFVALEYIDGIECDYEFSAYYVLALMDFLGTSFDVEDDCKTSDDLLTCKNSRHQFSADICPDGDVFMGLSWKR